MVPVARLWRALKEALLAAAGAVLGAASLLIWVAPAYLLSPYLGALGLRARLDEPTLLLLLSLAAGIGAASLATRKHPANPLLRALGRLLNVLAFSAALGLPVLSLSAAGLRLELDLSPLLAVILVLYVAAQSLLDVHARLRRR